MLPYPSTDKISVLRRSYSDFDEFADILTKIQRDLSLIQLDRGAFKANTTQISLGPFVVNHFKLNRRFLLQGFTPAGVSIFGLPVSMNSEGSWMRNPLGLKTVQRYAQGDEFEAVTPADFETITITVLRNVIETTFPSLKELNSKLDPESCLVIDCGKGAKSRLISKIFRLMNTIQQNPRNHESRIFVSYCIGEIAESLDLMQNSTNSSASTARRPIRVAIIKRAEEYIDSIRDNPISVQELRHHTYTSRSTLERAFGEFYGLSPKAYLIAHRLNGVRRMLKDSESHTTEIKEIAARWGYWHMGQFAADYRRQFGELPSNTLAKL